MRRGPEGRKAGGQPGQLAFELHGVVLAYHRVRPFLGEAAAGRRAVDALERLLRLAPPLAANPQGSGRPGHPWRRT